MCCTRGTLRAHQIKDKVACGEVPDALCITNVLQLPCLIALLPLLRVDTDIVGAVVIFGCGEKLAGKEPVHRGDACLWIIGCACGERHERRMRQDDGQAVKCLLRDRFMRVVIHRDWHIGEPVGVALHEECVSIAAERLAGTREHLEDRRLERAQTKGAFRADNGVLCISIREKILRGEDVGVCRIPARLAVRGELYEKVVVVGVLLRACEEVVKERRSPLVVVPECAEIVAHNISFLC